MFSLIDSQAHMQHRQITQPPIPPSPILWVSLHPFVPFVIAEESDLLSIPRKKKTDNSVNLKF